MECKQVRLLMQEYIDDEVSLELNEIIRDHLDQCSGCREEFESTALLIDNLSGISEQLEVETLRKEILKDALVKEHRAWSASSPFISALSRNRKKMKELFTLKENLSDTA